MNFAEVYHRTSDNYCYALNEDELIINIKTGYDVEEVYLYFGDPFETGILGGDWSWHGSEWQIIYKKRLKHQLWWTTTIKPEYKRCRYYFRLVAGGQEYYYFEDGFLTKEEMEQEGKMLECFTFPWMNKADINEVPDWVNKTVWYQIFPERFCNGDTSNDPENVRPWRYEPVRNDMFYGGDLAGVIEKLDYLQDLGVNGLYLTPIFKSDSAHKYDTIDYMEIDPHFGDKETFRKLVEQAHSKGIRIMLDGVFNHCGQQFAPWQDVLANGPQSKFYDWFMINQWPFGDNRRDTRDGRYYSFAFYEDMPKLNTNNKEVQDYILEVVRYWVTEFGIDGFRLDVANEISHLLCKKMRLMTKEIKSDFYLLGEIWHDSIHWLRGDEFDGVMNYPLASGIANFWLDQHLTKEDFEYAINFYYTRYMQQTNDVLFNLLDSHDTNRLMDKTKDLDVFYQQLTVLFTMPGSPCIYYGTEIAMEGKHDPDCRRPMPWKAIEDGVYDERLAYVKTLIKLRKENQCCKSRNFHFPNTIENKRVMEYIKIDYENQIQVILNCSDEEVYIPKGGKVLLSRLYADQLLQPKGVVIRRY